MLGWDAAGVVTAVGPDATLFHPGDEVFYAGAIGRPSANSECHLVDERIVGPKPRSLDWAEAAALPLTSITAWEALFDQLDVRKPVPGAAPTILVIGGAGGVGSIAVQLTRALTDLTVIATASRPETADWVRAMGAHHVVDHGKPLAAEVAALGIGAPAFVFSTTQTIRHLDEIAELIAPQGRFALIDDPATLNVNVFKRKSVSIHLELMYTRLIYGTSDMGEQGKLLAEVARLADAGALRTTITERVTGVDAANLQRGPCPGRKRHDAGEDRAGRLRRSVPRRQGQSWREGPSVSSAAQPVAPPCRPQPQPWLRVGESPSLLRTPGHDQVVTARLV